MTNNIFNKLDRKNYNNIFNDIANGLSTKRALTVLYLFKEYKHPNLYNKGDRFIYDNELYEVIKAYDTISDNFHLNDVFYKKCLW